MEQGDFLAIVGNNGCGKSTFCKALNGLIPQFISGDFSGRVLACGLDTRTSDVGALARKVGYVYQDFENQIIRPTVLDDASYACQNYAMPDYKERGMVALERCGLRGRESDFIWQLSGGQTHLLALAGALSLQPDVLILDEPIAQLDPAHADRIYGVLRELNERYGKTIIVIEHHTEYIADFCKHVMLAGRTDRLLERFRLSGLRDRDGRLLSGGQMRRASLAIGVALDPGILLLDEPTANLDIATRKEIMRTLEDLKEITETVVIATHDMQLVCEWAQRIIVLCGGKVVADGTRDEIFGDRALIERVGIRPPEIFAMGQALDPAALCYTIDDFLRCFEGRKPV